ncbi:hypothetical protein [Mesorhizobium xinjiangense]|nr:hypothetical protein [Mesorhizobium xinjiangense]
MQLPTRNHRLSILLLALAALAVASAPAFHIETAALAQECPNGNCPKQ